MSKKTKTILWIVIAVIAVAVLGILFQQFIAPRYAEISFSQFLEK